MPSEAFGTFHLPRKSELDVMNDATFKWTTFQLFKRKMDALLETERALNNE